MTVAELKSWSPEKVEFSTITEMADRIAHVANPFKIILFGSYARGNATVDSDVDLLVIAKSDEPPTKRSIPLYRELGDYMVPLDIIVRTPEEIEKYKEAPYSLIHAALKEGVTLYERG